MVGPLLPVTLAELKAYLRIESDLEDGLLVALLRAAVGQIEAWLGAPLVVRELAQEGLAHDGRLRLAHEPVEAVVGVARVAADGTRTELAAADWTVERLASGGAVVGLAAGGEPVVVVRYRAGLAGDWNGVPEPVRLAVLRVAAHAYANRDGESDAGLPVAARQLLSPFRRARLV
jgi:uncharacterized phiE125 gp8 family phage protein